MLSRILAWLVTGPVGHLAAGLAEWLRIAGKVARARLRGRPVEW